MLMEIFFTPELYKQDVQILNVVDEKQQPVGYFAFVIDEKKIYVYGHLENEGVSEGYKGMVTAYLEGLTKLRPETEIYSYIGVGGKKMEIKKSEG
jgi:hypothetical protein